MADYYRDSGAFTSLEELELLWNNLLKELDGFLTIFFRKRARLNTVGTFIVYLSLGLTMPKHMSAMGILLFLLVLLTVMALYSFLLKVYYFSRVNAHLRARHYSEHRVLFPLQLKIFGIRKNEWHSTLYAVTAPRSLKYTDSHKLD
jgi:hypothetical protein